MKRVYCGMRDLKIHLTRVEIIIAECNKLDVEKTLIFSRQQWDEMYTELKKFYGSESEKRKLETAQ